MIGNLLNKNSGCIYHVNIVTENVIYQSAGFIRHSCEQCDTWEKTMGDNHIKIDIAVRSVLIFNKFTLKSPHIYDVSFCILILLSKEEN